MNYLPTEKRLISSDGTSIYARAAGNPQNPSLVFVHGIMLSELVFDNLFKNKNLLDSFYLVSYDTRGHGRSGKPQEKEGHASSLYACDFSAVLQAFNLKSPIIVGWSLGGTVACDILAHLPPRTISGIVYASGIPTTSSIPLVTTSGPGSESAAQYAALWPSTDTGTGTTSDSDLLAANLRARIAFVDSLFRDPERVPPSVKWAWLGSTLLASPHDARMAASRGQDPSRLFAAGSGTGTGSGGNGTGEAADVDAPPLPLPPPLPLLLLNASADTLVSGDAVAHLVRPHFADMQVHTIDGASHAMFYEDEDAFVGVLVGFCERVFSVECGGE